MFADKEKIEHILKWLEQGTKTSRADNIMVSYITYSYKDNLLCS